MKERKTFENKLAIAGLFLSLVAGLFSYYEQSMLGFPDGHLTEYERFYKNVLFPMYFCLNILFFLVFMFSFFANKRSGPLLMVYLILLVVYQVTAYYFSLNLENGQGG